MVYRPATMPVLLTEQSRAAIAVVELVHDVPIRRDIPISCDTIFSLSSHAPHWISSLSIL
jgi:hypothetical protein